jgi:hypothetical protein
VVGASRPRASRVVGPFDFSRPWPDLGIGSPAATKGGDVEYWAAATPHDAAVWTVQQLLGPGWTASMTDRRLTGQAAGLKLRPNGACKLKHAI